MTIDPVPTSPVETEPRGSVGSVEQHALLLAELRAAGVELGEYDRRIIEWLTLSPGYGWSTVATIASWVKRADHPLATDATEYRVLLPELGGVELRVRKATNGLHTFGWSASISEYGGGRAWTTEGWQTSISALSMERLFCWPDAETAIKEARSALSAADDS
ncbi:hypothetical protein ACFYMH_30875 [Streptomyces albidoflavus]